MGKTIRKIPIVRWGFHKNYRSLGKIMKDQKTEIAANEAMSEFVEDLETGIEYVGPRPQWLRITKWAEDDHLVNKDEVWRHKRRGIR